MDPVVICFYANVCSKLLLVGDSLQQKYDASNRTAATASRCKSLAESIIGDVARLTVSYAVPLDVMAYLAGKFPWARTFKTINPILSSIKFAALSDTLKSANWRDRAGKAFTFSKRSSEIHKVRTMPPTQGYREMDCDLIVTGDCATTASKVPAQVFVALTRHKRALTISTMAAGVRMLFDVKPISLTQNVGSRDAFATQSGYRAFYSATYDTGAYASATTTEIKQVDPIISQEVEDALLLRPQWQHSTTKFSVPESCQVNKAVSGGFQLFAVEAPLTDLPDSLAPGDIDVVDVAIPLGNHCGATALVEDILQKIAPSSSEPYEFRRETGYQHLGDNRDKTLRIRNSNRPILNPEATSGVKVIPLLSSRLRRQIRPVPEAHGQDRGADLGRPCEDGHHTGAGAVRPGLVLLPHRLDRTQGLPAQRCGHRCSPHSLRWPEVAWHPPAPPRRRLGRHCPRLP